MPPFSALDGRQVNADFLQDFFLSVAEGVSSLLHHWFDSTIDTPVVGRVGWADLGASAVLLLLVLVAWLALALALRLWTRHRQGEPQDGMRQQVLQALGRPLYLLIWFYGLYFACVPLLQRLPDNASIRFLAQLLDRGLDLGAFVACIWLFYRFTYVLEARLGHWAKRTESALDDMFVPLLGRGLRITVPVMGVIFGLPLLGLPTRLDAVLARGSSILLILALALVAFQAIGVGERYVLTRFDMQAKDNLRARKVYTQVHVLVKVLYVVLALFTAASILMMFEEVRRFGASILASAGVVGIIIGFAAQKTIANVFAGFQIALSQPIRIDDVVIVEGEWGRIEEISLTFVTVCIWDNRRLIVPLGYFIEKPFQNWTRVSAELLGSVMLWVDYTLPLEPVRARLKQIIESDPLWDGRFWNLQVTDSSERSMQLRVLATTADSSKGWNLRCTIREQLIAYIQDQYPQCLPRLRAEVGAGPQALAVDGLA